MLIAYIWIVFFSAGALVRERDHIRFDMLYRRPAAPRRWLAIVTTAIVAVLFVAGLPGMFDYVTFMKMPVRATRYALFLVLTVLFGLVPPRACSGPAGARALSRDELCGSC